ncbi:MAG: LuxR C-terminal-related transcriptional regulator [Hyphomicrobiaceae bacterium]
MTTVSNAPVDVGLADSNPLMLGALSEFIERDARFSLVATSKTAEGFIEVVLRANVTVGIIDWNLPSLGGEQLLEILRAQDATPRIVVYSHDTNADIARRAMAAGAAGFCSRSDPAERLLDVVAEVASGRMVFPFLDVRALQRDPMDTLTNRERSLIELLARGHSNKALAQEIGISVNTVKFHLRNLYEKLSVDSRAQAIALYYTSSSRASVPANAPVEVED